MDDDAADAAISSLDGSEIDGRNLKVNKSKGKS
jgi:RNA recognition motif-containing protein